MKKYLLNILICLDMLILSIYGIVPLIANLFGFNISLVEYRQTISGYLGKNYDKSFLEFLVNKLFYNRFWKIWSDNEHCSDVYIIEEKMDKDLNY